MRPRLAHAAWISFATLTVLGAASVYIGRSAPEPPLPLSGAHAGLNYWAKQRAYPSESIPDVGHFLAFANEEQKRRERQGIEPTPPPPSTRTETGDDPAGEIGIVAGDPALDTWVAPWVPMGPDNVGGRTLALAFHPVDPDILYAGSASGGLWRTTTAGVGASAWHYVETGYPVLGVSTIAIDETDPDVIYIGTGEVYQYQNSIGGEVDRTTRGSYGIGILKSTDAGVSWAPSLDWTYQQSRGVWAVAIHPDDSEIVFAATTEGVLRSTDAGGSWSVVHGVTMAVDLKFSPVDPSTIFVSCGNFGTTGTGIYRSTNGGDSWTELGNGLPSHWTGKAILDVSPADPARVLASIANANAGLGVYRSTDSGSSWSRLSASDFAQYQGWYSHWVHSHRSNPLIVLAGGIDTWRSSNGGSSLFRKSDWSAGYRGTPPPGGPEGPDDYVHADNHFAVSHPFDADIIYFGTDGGVFRTLDAGLTFEGLNGGYQITQYYNGYSTSAVTPDLAIGGLQDNMTVIYRGTHSWQYAIGGDGMWTAMHPTNSDVLYGSYYFLNLLRSTDQGNSFFALPVPPAQDGESTAFCAPFVLCPGDPSRMYGGREKVYTSTNGGSNWSVTNSGFALDPGNPILVMAVSATDPDVAYAGTAPESGRSRYFRTGNGGGTWSEITGILPDRYPGDIEVDPNDHDRVFVAISGFGSSHLFRSTDGGQNFEDIGSSLPDVPTSAVIVDPEQPTVVYAGNDLGVYASSNSGDGWEMFIDGMPTAMVSDLKVSNINRMLRVATHGNGTYQRQLIDLQPTDVADGNESIPLDDRTRSVVQLRTWPNPIEARSEVVLTLGESLPVSVAIYDVSGSEQLTLARETLDVGTHRFPIDRSELGAGVYFLRAQAGPDVRTERIVVVK